MTTNNIEAMADKESEFGDFENRFFHGFITELTENHPEVFDAGYDPVVDGDESNPRPWCAPWRDFLNDTADWFEPGLSAEEMGARWADANAHKILLRLEAEAEEEAAEDAAWDSLF